MTGGDESGDPIEDAPRFNEEVLSAEDRRQMNRRYELQVIALSLIFLFTWLTVVAITLQW